MLNRRHARANWQSEDFQFPVEMDGGTIVAMGEPTDAARLDYHMPPKTLRRVRPRQTDEERRWRYKRVAYHTGLIALFASVAFYFGRNRIRFGQFTRLSPSDFAPFALRFGNPIVRGIKRYQQDTGHLPPDGRLESLEPKYIARGTSRNAFMEGRQIRMFGGHGEWVRYDLTPGQEGWSVEGPFARGSISIPAVRLRESLSTQP